MNKNKPDKHRRLSRREYDYPTLTLRKLFYIPNDELIIDFIYDKKENKLILTTLHDYNRLIDI